MFIEEVDSLNDSQSQLNLIRNTIAKDIFKDEHTFQGGSVAWKVHPDKPVEYICKTERVGLCSKCLYSHYKEGHQITWIKEIFKNMDSMIEDMELKVMDAIKSNKDNLSESQSKLESYISNKNHLLQK